jgi:hypothetical protein
MDRLILPFTARLIAFTLSIVATAATLALLVAGLESGAL